jgi:hypothetical protein
MVNDHGLVTVIYSLNFIAKPFSFENVDLPAAKFFPGQTCCSRERQRQQDDEI